MGKNSNVMDLEQTNMGAFTEAIKARFEMPDKYNLL